MVLAKKLPLFAGWMFIGVYEMFTSACRCSVTSRAFGALSNESKVLLLNTGSQIIKSLRMLYGGLEHAVDERPGGTISKSGRIESRVSVVGWGPYLERLLSRIVGERSKQPSTTLLGHRQLEHIRESFELLVRRYVCWRRTRREAWATLP